MAGGRGVAVGMAVGMGKGMPAAMAGARDDSTWSMSSHETDMGSSMVNSSSARLPCRLPTLLTPLTPLTPLAVLTSYARDGIVSRPGRPPPPLPPPPMPPMPPPLMPPRQVWPTGSVAPPTPKHWQVWSVAAIGWHTLGGVVSGAAGPAVGPPPPAVVDGASAVPPWLPCQRRLASR